MSSEERRKILQMVEEGKISAEDAASLMRALDEDSVEEHVEALKSETGSGFEGDEASTPEFEKVKAHVHRFATVPLWMGVGIAVLSAWGIFTIQQNTGVNFWFFCLMFPLLLGVLLVAIGSAGQGSKWLYVNVDRRYADDWPKNITLGFPLPIGLTAWFMRTFGHNIRGMNKTQVDGIVEVLDTTNKSDDPFIINVDDDDNGDRVHVYIG
jgi:SHOCT-like domain